MFYPLISKECLSIIHSIILYWIIEALVTILVKFQSFYPLYHNLIKHKSSTVIPVTITKRFISIITMKFLLKKNSSLLKTKLKILLIIFSPPS